MQDPKWLHVVTHRDKETLLYLLNDLALDFFELGTGEAYRLKKNDVRTQLREVVMRLGGHLKFIEEAELHVFL